MRDGTTCCPYRDLNSQCINQIRISGTHRISGAGLACTYVRV